MASNIDADVLGSWELIVKFGLVGCWTEAKSKGRSASNERAINGGEA